MPKEINPIRNNISNGARKTTSWLLILTILFLMVGLSVFAPETKADQSDSSASVTNSLPVASSASINLAAASMTLTEATTAAATVTFTVTDNNGCEDIDSHASNDTIAVFYRTDVASGAACAPDAANCYAMSCIQDADTCTAGGTDLAATYTCTASVQFYADPTDAGSTYAASDWTTTVTPRDNAGTDGTPSTDTIEMNSLTALNVTATIVYGALALNANTGASDQTTTVTNTGNRLIDAQVDGYGTSDGDGRAMTCTIGAFALSYERYATTTPTNWSDRTQLTDTAATIADFDLAKGAASTKPIYWGLGLPATGVGGSCSGKVNFTATNG